MSHIEINKQLFNSYWSRYKEYLKLPDSEQSEKYKWSVLKQVYDKWNWNSTNKVNMFKNAFDVKGSKNLWESGNFFAVGHTKWMFENFEEETIEAFNILFNEDIDLIKRLNQFIAFYNEKLPLLNNLIPDKKIVNHYHGDLRAIALYLTLQYPEKYFLFKYSMIKDFSQKMELPKIKRGKKENLESYINISNQLLEFILEDDEFIEEYRNFTNKENNYNDSDLHLLTQDFIYTVANHFKEENDSNFVMENNIFKLYEEYLIDNRSKDIQQGTIDNYVEVASKVIPERWEKAYFSNFENFEINYKNLNKIEPLLKKGFSGYTSFIPFINILLKQTEFKYPLNKILYGPPGTGKTYKTKELAVKIIDGFAPKDRQELLKRYEELMDSRQIHFTTFHQSMSYEDFIEGIKPKMNDENSAEIEYEIRSGLFKQICELANKKQIVNFEIAYGNLIRDISESDDEFLVLKTPREKEYRLNVNSNDNLNLYTSKEIKKQGVLSKSKLQRQFEGENVYQGWEGYANGVIDYLEKNYNLYKREESIRKKQVLIIDEINRGNVSAIFGELITLIEEDKRIGKKETIYVTLPYSQEKFGVPSNIYIVGTMNTADRSVEALDTALRRRFSFEELLPKPELLEEHKYQDVNLNLLLDKINKRIELLTDKDHQIGHSYFFNINSLDDLKLVFKDKIIPLLEEYFYGDFGKIGLVLGENFIEPLEEQNKNIFANFKDYDDIDFVSDKKNFRLHNINKLTESDFISIYQNKE